MNVLVDTVNSFMSALQSGQLNSAAGKMDNNFFFGGWTPETLDKNQFLDLMRSLKVGIPDLDFHVQNLAEIENTNTVQGAIDITGKNTGILNLSVLEVQPVNPTGRSISLPTQNVVYVVENNLVTRMTVTPVAGGGIQGLLQQLGVNSPAL